MGIDDCVLAFAYCSSGSRHSKQISTGCTFILSLIMHHTYTREYLSDLQCFVAPHPVKDSFQ